MTSTQVDRVTGQGGSLALKAPVACIAATAITLSGEQTIDGVATSGSRVLVNGQSDATTNGIYISSTSAWARAADCDGTNDLVKGTMVLVVGGTTNAATFWKCATADTIVVGTSSISFSQVTIGQQAFTPTGATIPSNGLYLPAANNPAIAVNSAEGFSFSNYSGTGTAVNYLEALNCGTGFFPVLQSRGSDTNIGIVYATKGNEGHIFNTNGPQTGSPATQFTVTHTANSVNYFNVTGAGTGNYPVLTAKGSDSAIGLIIMSKGATNGLEVHTSSNGNRQMIVSHTASAVNYFNLTGSATGTYPTISGTGSDSNVGVQYLTKGSGSHNFYTSAGGNNQFRITHTASSVNYINATGAGTGNYPVLTATGTDTNIGLRIVMSGSGFLQVPAVNSSTTASAANVNVDSSGNLLKSTSSIQYKRDVIPYDKGLNAVLSLKPVYYKSRSEMDGETQYAGLIAEDIEATGLREFVLYQNGKADGLAYGNMVALAFKAIQEMNDRLLALETH